MSEERSLGCARCGDCCDPVIISSFNIEKFVAHWSTPALADMADPSTDAGWAYWQESGWKDRDLAIERFDPDGRTRHNADFMLERWQVVSTNRRQSQIETFRVACDAFDTETRLCTAHETRPPICSEFPYYGADTLRWDASGEDNPGGDRRCSYWLDVPPANRPTGARPLIPLEVL